VTWLPLRALLAAVLLALLVGLLVAGDLLLARDAPEAHKLSAPASIMRFLLEVICLRGHLLG